MSLGRLTRGFGLATIVLAAARCATPHDSADVIGGCVQLAEDHYGETAWSLTWDGRVHERRLGPLWLCRVRIHDVAHGGIDYEAYGVGTWGRMLWTDQGPR